MVIDVVSLAEVQEVLSQFGLQCRSIEQKPNGNSFKLSLWPNGDHREFLLLRILRTFDSRSQMVKWAKKWM